MSTTAVKTGPTSADLKFPAGDTVVLNISATTPGVDWTGKTWSGEVRENPSDASALYTFSFVDSSGDGTLDLVATLSASDSANLSSETAPYHARIRYTSGSVVHTLCTLALYPGD